MAVREVSAAGGKASETTAWVEGKKPVAGDDVVFGAGSGELKVNETVKWRSLESVEGFKSKLVIEGINKVELGAATLKEDKYTFNWLSTAANSMTTTGKISFIGTSTEVEKIRWPNHSGAAKYTAFPEQIFNSATGKWELVQETGEKGAATGNSAILELKKGEFKTGGFDIYGFVEIEVQAEGTMTFGKSKVYAPTTSNQPFKFLEAATISASEATFTVKARTGEGKFNGHGHTYGSFVIEGSTTFWTIEGSSTYGVIEFTTTNTKEVKFEKGSTQTVERLVNSTGKEVKLVSTEAGKKWKIKASAGEVVCEKFEVKDSEASGAVFLDKGGKDLGENIGWTIEENFFSIKKKQRIHGELTYTEGTLEAKSGTTIEYQIIIKNEGAETLKFKAFSDSGTTGIEEGLKELAPGEQTEYKCKRVLPGKAETINNSASIEGDGGTGKRTSNTAKVVVIPEPNFTIRKFQKIESSPAFTEAELPEVLPGEEIKYLIQVENTGNTTLHFTDFTDTGGEEWAETEFSLLPSVSHNIFGHHIAGGVAGPYENKGSITGDEGTGTKTSNTVIAKIVVHPVEIVMGAAKSTSSASLEVTAPTSLVLEPAHSISSTIIDFEARNRIPFNLGSSTSTALLKFSVPETDLGVAGIRSHIRERPPLRLNMVVESPSGEIRRWGEDERDPQYAPKSTSFSTTMPGGFERLSTTLERKPAYVYMDDSPLTKLTVYGPGGAVAWQGRIEKLPDTGGYQSQETVEAVGYQANLEDDNSAREIYLDQEQSRWAASPLSRKILLVAAGYKVEDATIGAGAQEPDEAGEPAVITHLQGPWDGSVPLICEAWYDAQGIPIGSLYFATKRGPTLTGEGSTPWSWRGFLVGTENAEGSIVGSNNQFESPSPLTVEISNSELKDYSFAFIQLFHSASPAEEEVDYQVFWTCVGIYGLARIPVYIADQSKTTNEAPGILASDVVMDAVGRWAKQIKKFSIDPSTFIIPQLVFFEPTTVAEIIRQASRFELPDWAVWEGPTFHYHQRGGGPIKKWRSRIGPAQLAEAGPQISHMWNGVVVQYTDVTGKARTVGPPGYQGGNSESESPHLVLPGEESLLNAVGINKWALLRMSTSTVAGAIEVGERFLQEQRQLENSGQANLVGHVEDQNGIWWPAWMVRAGDEIAFVDSAEPGYRRIISTNYDDMSKTNSIQLDQPPDGMQALLERLSVSLVGVGL